MRSKDIGQEDSPDGRSLLRGNGRVIRRQIERRYDAILNQLAHSDPEAVRRTPAARWLLDNSHSVRQALQQIESDLPRGYLRQLHAIDRANRKSQPRIFNLVENSIAASGLPIDCDSLETACRDYRSKVGLTTQLTLGELWAIPTALRISILNRLCEAAEIALAQGSEDAGNSESDADVTTVAGCITSLQTIASFSWRDFVERCSSVERVLRQDPDEFYGRMDFATRNRYRAEVERIARRAPVEQVEVAQAALEMTLRADDGATHSHRRHVGFYLIDDGREPLEAAVQYRPSPAERFLRWTRSHSIGLYLGSVVALALAGCAVLLAMLLRHESSRLISIFASLTALVPLLSVSSGVVNFLTSLWVGPRPLPKMDFTNGLPVEQRSIVVVPMLLSSVDEITENLATLERNYLGNSDANLQFALLSDFVDADIAETIDDQALLNHAIDGIDELNRRHATDTEKRRPFMLFHRRRLWNENAQRWMGWERKRGKLEEFNDLLRGVNGTSYVLQHGDDFVDAHLIRSVITLDADSYLPTDSARRLIGALAHPLNRPRFDAEGCRVIAGYTIIQPRLEVNPVTGADTLFTRVFAGDVMLDLYTHAVSDVYQDLFHEAVFAGKGVYDVDAFRQSAAGKIPANTVLSHDLLEGLLGRAGLASDIVVLENYPDNYLTYLKRLHRWTRGDWQLLPWLASRQRRADASFVPGWIGSFKMIDNLRRSLVTPAILTLLVFAWLWLPGDPLVWSLLFALFPGLPILLRITLALRTSLWRWGTIESSARNLVGQAGADAARWLLALVFLPAEAYVVCDAIARTLYRVAVSHRRLLEWSTAAQDSRDFSKRRPAISVWYRLWFGPAFAMLTGLAIATMNPHALPAAAAFLLTWIGSPLIALLLGRSLDVRAPMELTNEDEQLLRGVARDTWRFFERFVGAETNWLPPDNVQEYPSRSIAERTSPTNIGMLLLSTLAAFDFGYIGQRQLLTRLTSHLQSIRRLEKHRGHLFNWYETRGLAPLEPRYVSTVDSGNFISALITVRQALRELSDRAHSFDRNVNGLFDELAAMRRQLFVEPGSESEPTIVALYELLDKAQSALSDTDRPLATAQYFEEQVCSDIERAFLDAVQHNPKHWGAEEIAGFRENAQVFRQRIRALVADIHQLAPWTSRLLSPPEMLGQPRYQSIFATLFGLLNTVHDDSNLNARLDTAKQQIANLLRRIDNDSGETAEACRAWLDALARDIEDAQMAIATLNTSQRELVREIDIIVARTDFRFLYDANRNLFCVGYHASTGELDTSHYDLLASEARIASFVAIANGDAPAKHWMHLGRPLTRIRGLRILLSWSATAFEYLMPRLIMRSPPRGLLDQSCAGAVRQQIRFGRTHGIPWGVSESGYAQFDPHNHYQYFAFGIPKLGLKWDQGERLVISSYASVLALPYAQAETLKNLRQIISLKALGHYGLYEAMDFGESHKARPARPRVVQSYMAHHQGMILVALGNALHNDEMPGRFHRDPHIASVEHLLYERLPQRLQTRALERLPAPLKQLPVPPAAVTQWPVNAAAPELAILSNGRLSTRVSGQGGGALYYRGNALTRWDPVSEGPLHGNCLYFKDIDEGLIGCFGGEPLPPDVDVLFAPHTAEFRAHRKDMLLRMTISIAPSNDVEIRQITMTNDSGTARHVLLCAYSEPVIGRDIDDQRHPAFSKLFIEQQILKEQRLLLSRRRSREPGQQSMYLAQTAIVPTGIEVEFNIETDRNAFFGRSGSRRQPAALADASYRFGNTDTPNLDACAAIGLTLTIPPRSTMQCAFLSAVGEKRADVIATLQSMQSLDRIAWVIEAARLQSEQELTAMHADSSVVQAAYQLLARILWPGSLANTARSPSQNVRNVQDTLWRHGVSGDRAIVSIRIDGEEDIPPATSLLKSMSYLSNVGFSLDAVFLDDSKGGYTFPTNDRLRRLIDKYLATGHEHNGASAFIVPVRNLAAGEQHSLIAAARLFVDPRAQTIGRPLVTAARSPYSMPAFVPQPSAPLSDDNIAPVELPAKLLFRTPLGGMLPKNEGYMILVSHESRTPAPWCNVLANPTFGTVVSESGSMCTWWGNSSEYRLSPWGNDAVLDNTGEAIYVRDEETGEFWSLTPKPCKNDAPYRVTHAIGESRFEHNSRGLEQELRVFVDHVEPIKVARIRLTNRWPRKRRLTVTFAVEWVLGNHAGIQRHLLLPDRDSETGALFVRNAFNRDGGQELAFVCSSLPAHGVSAQGAEFLGPRRSWEAPAALVAVGLSDRVEQSTDPYAIYQVHIDIGIDETQEFHFFLGAANDGAAAKDLILHARNPEWIDERQKLLQRYWSDLLTTWQVETPDMETDAMVNRWLLYQVISSRVSGRTGFYQASGGFGYRDQLQDVLALLDTNPAAAREQITIAAARQFEEGDVLHWWHEAPLRGVRTRCSDDLLWLVYAVAEYIETTDDRSILDDSANFLQGEPLAEHELERYAEYDTGPIAGTIYEHCCRAIDARTGVGAHGLPLIGTGDWNDGLNRVGEKGKGESVWMAWFLIVVCRRFAPLCRLTGERRRAEHYESLAAKLLQHTQATAWAGDWYLRGYFDDGTPLGAPGNDESEIDLNAQTWAVFADPQDTNADRAMHSIEKKLIDTNHRIIKLLAPPFEKTVHDPGYIRSYPPGVRENGGQYTHAAVWAAWAAAELGDASTAMRWFRWLNPLNRARSGREINHYRLEPYVTAGDIYGVGLLAGRGGWSWYTGSAAWLYRLAIRRLLGLQRSGNRLFVRPCLPASWPEFRATLRYGDARYHFHIHDPAKIRNDALYLFSNGSTSDDSSITLNATGDCKIDVFATDAARRDWLDSRP